MYWQFSLLRNKVTIFAIKALRHQDFFIKEVKKRKTPCLGDLVALL
jgi:hypothetical protein